MSPSSQVPFGLIDAQSSFLHTVTFPDGTTEKGGLKGQLWKRKDMGGHVRIVSFMDCGKHDQPCVRPLVSMSTVAKWLKHQKGSVVLLRRCGAQRRGVSEVRKSETWPTAVWSNYEMNKLFLVLVKLTLPDSPRTFNSENESTPAMGQWGNVAAGKVRFKMLQASGCLPFYIHGHLYIYIYYIYVCIYSQSHISLESGCDVKYPKTDRPGMGASLGWLSPWQKRSSAWRFHQLSRWTCIFSLCHATSCNNHSGTKKSNQLHNHSPAIHPYTQGLPTHEAKDRRPIHRPTWIPARAQLDASKNCPLCHGFETSFLFI